MIPQLLIIMYTNSNTFLGILGLTSFGSGSLIPSVPPGARSLMPGGTSIPPWGGGSRGQVTGRGIPHPCTLTRSGARCFSPRFSAWSFVPACVGGGLSRLPGRFGFLAPRVFCGLIPSAFLFFCSGCGSRFLGIAAIHHTQFPSFRFLFYLFLIRVLGKERF